MLPTEGRKHFFKKVSRNCKKKLLRACGANERERIARAIHKLKVSVQAFLIVVGFLGVKDAQGTGQSGIFMGI